MQQDDLLNSLFQKPPQQSQFQQQQQQQQPASAPGPSELQQAAPDPRPTDGQGSKDIESLFRGLVPQPPPGAATSPSTVPLPVTSPPESVLSSSANTTAANTDRTLLSLLGTVGGPQAPPRETPPPPLATNAPAPGSAQSQQGKLLLEQLVSGTPPNVTQPITQAPVTTTNPTTMAASHSVPPPATHGSSAASAAIPGHLSDREAAVDAQRKALFDFISPYDALQANQPSQLYNIQPVAASQSQGPPLAKKKPVPAYNPSPAPGSAHASPHQSPRMPNLQRRHTPSPEPVQYSNFQQQLQQQMSQHLPPSDRDLYPEPPQPPDHTSFASAGGPVQGLGSAPASEENRSIPLPQSGSSGPHGPLPPIPGGQRGSPLSGGAARVQQPLPSPPLRPAHPGPTPAQIQAMQAQQQAPPPQQQRQSPPPQQVRQPEYVQQVVQGQRGRGSPASSRQPGGQQPQQMNGGGREGAGSPVNVGGGKKASKIQQQQQQPAPGAYSSPSQRNGRPPQYSPAAPSLITIDVTSPLSSTLAAADIVGITPIALLKLEPVYTRGTTIGVANFIAYSMSRGRIRLIGRQTGERALLKLPATFPGHAQVQDMVISGTKLACVSTDGGLVVWDIPEDIEDDAAAVSRIILHVPPHQDVAGFKVVKWHPKQAGILAVASEKEIYLLNIEEAHSAFGSEGVTQSELGRVATVFAVPSPLVSFTFDVPQIALASVSIDSTVTLWSMKDKRPFWSGRVHGEGVPSSIDFLDGGLVVGRNQGNIIQLLPVMSTTVLSTIKFILGNQSNGSSKAAIENPDLMFGHLSYDPASKILWVASSARNSLFAVKIGQDLTPIPSAIGGVGAGGPVMSTTEPTLPTVRPTFDQIIEFPCSMPTINITVVAAEAADDGSGSAGNSNWTRDPSLAVSAFCVHAGGVDQINIAQDAFEEAAEKTAAKLPNIAFLPVEKVVPVDRRASTQSQQQQQSPAQQQVPMQQKQQQQQYTASGFGGAIPQQQVMQPTNLSNFNPNQRSRTPPGEPPISAYEQQQQQQAVLQQQQQVHMSPNVQPPSSGKTKARDSISKPVQQWKASPSTVPTDQAGSSSAGSRLDTDALTSNLTKEIRKVEENLNNKIGRLIVKELDKQDVRLEEVRRADQTADFERQEKILKLISTELTKNTTRVVESAVKNVIQNSVLPALETVTRNEVKVALNNQIAKGLSESMKQTLPAEIEKLLLRPDVSNHVARTFSAAVTPTVERHVKETITNTLIPSYTQVTSQMQQEMAREFHAEILNLRKEVVTWQSEALKGTESLVRDMEQSIRGLAEQVKTLSAQVSANTVAANSAAAAAVAASTSTPRSKELDYSHLRQVPGGVPSPSHNAPAQQYVNPYPQSWVPQQQQAPLPPQPVQAQLGLQQMAPKQQQQQQQPLVRQEDWDETFLSTLGLHDQFKLRELLLRAPRDTVMPIGQPSPLSQTVILALVHRLALSLTEMSPADESFNTVLWWLQRSVIALNPNDNIIAPYIGRVLQTAAGTLNTTSQRLNVLPGGPSLAETNSLIGQIQQNLSGLMT